LTESHTPLLERASATTGARSSSTRLAEDAPTAGPGVYLVWLLLLAGILPWRRDVYYDGGLDPVVIGKAIIGIAALAMAAVLARRSRRHHRIGILPLGLLSAFVAIAMLGGQASDNLSAAAVSSVRLAMLAATIVLVVRANSPRRVLKPLLTSMALFGLTAAASGIGSLFSAQRLSATIPPLNPNDIALLCAAPAIGLVHQLLLGNTRWLRGIPMLAVLIGIVFATQSRTGLLAMLVGIVVVVLHVRRLQPRAAIGLALLAPVLFGIVAFTGVVDSLVLRGDPTGQDLMTLSARTIAWNAVLSTPDDTWARWVGSGMAVRQVHVAGQYWDNQVLDSSWISALAQAGVVGVAIMAILVLSVAVWSLQSKRLRSITTPLIAFLLIRSFLENGLIDTNVMFMLFFSVALLLDAERLEQRAAPLQ
jgi:hypothetical protein